MVEGNTHTGGLHIGNLTLGGRKAGRFENTLVFRIAEAALDHPPLMVGADRAAALEWTRLAVPIPTMMPSLNQIGFDYMDWILGAVEIGEPGADGVGRLIMWAIGGKRDKNGVLVADPESDFTLPLSGVYRGDSFIVTNRRFTMQVTGIPIPFNALQLRGQLGADGRVRGATAYADTEALSIPTFGPLLVIAGLANNWWQKLLVMATYVTRPYEAGPANRRPEGISVESLEYTTPTGWRGGRVTVTFRLEEGAHYPLATHRPGILLVDAVRRQAVYLDYHQNLSAAADEVGNLATAALAIPAGTRLPEKLEAVVLLDVFPLYKQKLT